MFIPRQITPALHRAIDQPKDFLHNNHTPLIIDEAQHAPG